MNHTPSEAAVTRVATFKIGQADYDQLERLAIQDDRSVSAVLRLAVRQYLDGRIGSQEKAAA